MCFSFDVKLFNFRLFVLENKNTIRGTVAVNKEKDYIELEYGNSKIRCYKSGKGEEHLIAFHGYGERSSMFLSLSNKIPDRFTLYAVDLPLHGSSSWREKKIRGVDFIFILEQLMKSEGLEKCSLMGFSLGGRIALYLTEKIPYLIENIYLIAPDGILSSGLYRSVQSVPDVIKFGTFRILVNKRTAKLAERLYKRGWLNHHNYRFSEVHFATAEKRKRLLIYWMALGRFDPDWKKARTVIQKHKIKMKVFLATHDEVIPSAAGRVLTQGVEHSEIIFIHSNHRQIYRAFLKKAEELL